MAIGRGPRNWRQTTLRPTLVSVNFPEYRSDGVVTLTDFQLGDAHRVVLGDHDPEHRLRFDFPKEFQPSLPRAAEVIKSWHQDADRGTRFTYAVRDAQTGVLVGGCELQPRPQGTAALSYWTYAAHRGRGIATRAVELALTIARECHAFTRIIASVDRDNLASQKVLLHNGFVRQDGISPRDRFAIDLDGHQQMAKLF